MAKYTSKFDHAEHSVRGPSAAHRWIRCPGSIAKCKGLPDTAGIEAAYGTVFHHFAALVLKFGADPYGFVGTQMEVKPHGMITFDLEMADAMQNGLDLIESYRNEGCIVIIEEKVSLEEWVGEGEFGTADVIIIDLKNWRIICFDWKYGEGVLVFPERNEQAMLYTLGAWSTFARDALDTDDEIPVTIIIEQPRAAGGGVWETTMGYLLEEGERIKRAAALTYDEDAPLVPGDKQCSFCPAAKHNTCEARAAHILDLVGLDLDEIESAPHEPLELPRAVTPEARSAILRHSTDITGFLATLHAEAYNDAENGRPVPGLKLVPGRRPPRTWKDAKKAEPILVHRLGENDAYYPRKILSPPEVEKVVGKRTYKEQYARHVTQGEAKPILVPDDDTREAIKASVDYLPDPDDVETLV